MLRNNIRRYSIKNIPFEAQPKNKYNAQRSAFNLKPVPTQGLVHNPPASVPIARNTPKAFLPPNDPRLHKLEGKYKTYSADVLEDMPVIYGMAKEKDYSMTAETAREILKLRTEDPSKWTVSKLAKEFNVSKQSVNVVTMKNEKRGEEVISQLEVLQEKWTNNKLMSRNDRRKRVQMWLRNEY
ncbi:DEHA2E09570p [Debaryomyces hansenii CBS767]|jgi:hypothetical protein|uniref:DEHA2E09570p n=1 Tax=Debaryomyces hansenii (strain ATCC 36239 / CBS 767 / BCRC 21394 / JCM 1990 / NBRC 0083 / IGC 2968) TaxID=284592 RepID=Q6BPZ8_DEBHA|nr:DEHA2E09570p [Debaryomyces hansenii CBS767]CAG87958.1 DEHA2E09570p [Debaryomyces hansenii CBS767]|eukprot:XP_459722.1 DEHA2E09570p [Debaryomyces hansenii CBS767]